MGLTDDLSKINAAIAAIEGGAQEYRVGNRMLKRPDLSMLYAERRNIRLQMQAEDPGVGLFGRTSVAEFSGR